MVKCMDYVFKYRLIPICRHIISGFGVTDMIPYVSVAIGADIVDTTEMADIDTKRYWHIDVNIEMLNHGMDIGFHHEFWLAEILAFWVYRSELMI